MFQVYLSIGITDSCHIFQNYKDEVSISIRAVKYQDGNTLVSQT
jgi:hypothetical protein